MSPCALAFARGLTRWFRFHWRGPTVRKKCSTPTSSSTRSPEFTTSPSALYVERKFEEPRRPLISTFVPRNTSACEMVPVARCGRPICLVRSHRNASGTRTLIMLEFSFRIVNETLEATGYGVRKGHAKNEASRIYAINRGFRVPSPLS